MKSSRTKEQQVLKALTSLACQKEASEDKGCGSSPGQEGPWPGWRWVCLERTEDGKQKGAAIGTLSIQLMSIQPLIHKRLNGIAMENTKVPLPQGRLARIL